MSDDRMRYDTEEFSDGKGRTRHGMPAFYNLLTEMAETHDKKSHDYASNNDPSGNYHFAGKLAILFAHSPEDAGFVGRLGEKMYRLANLQKDGKEPQNESIEDTERDIAVIVVMWMADRRVRRNRVTAVRKEEIRTGVALGDGGGGAGVGNQTGATVLGGMPYIQCKECGVTTIHHGVFALRHMASDRNIQYFFCSVFHRKEYIRKFIADNPHATYYRAENLLRSL